MRKGIYAVLLAAGVLLVLCIAVILAKRGTKPPSTIAPAKLARIGAVDERFQSYNIEMVEVTGGRFWKPYTSKIEESPAAAKQANANQPAGMDPSKFQYRPPIDLSNKRLRKLAAALGPAYLRVSGTWANSTYFQNTDEPAPATPPKGFNGVLTRKQWKGVVDFSHAVNAEIVTSFAISAGTRNAEGVWTAEQARKILEFTKSAGGSIAAAEYMNEPNLAEMGGAPKGYDAAAYARDFAVFRGFMKSDYPRTVILGPGGVGEDGMLSLLASSMHRVSSKDILAATGPVFDGFSYHSYGGVSIRCMPKNIPGSPTAEKALTGEWLASSGKTEAFYADLRDRYDPWKPIWLTETAQAACGGDRWASTYLDSFRYLNQLGALAKHGVQVHMHNTLAASDYGLLDENTYQPRPNYWAALLWRKLMGTTVLDAGASTAPNLHVYAQCLRYSPGGVALLIINADPAEAKSLEVSAASERYTLTVMSLQDTRVQLNGMELQLGADDALPELKGIATNAGPITFAPASITFLAIPTAENASCK
jgi:hypothetical protein